MVVRISKNRVALENIPLNEAIGANIASASTINLTTVTGNTVHLTGTTTITAVTLGAGMIRDVIFDGILTLTHHATNNNLPSGANITTAVNDRARYIGDGTTVYCVSYQKADGTAVVVAAQTLPSYKIIAFTRDVSTASGTQAITGVGFTPRFVIFHAALGDTYTVSYGEDDGTTAVCNFVDIASSGYRSMSSESIKVNPSAGNHQAAHISAFGSDGFTLTWTKTGSPTGDINGKAFVFK